VKSVGLEFVEHDTSIQQRALAIGMTATMYPCYVEALAARFNVSRATAFKYYRLVKNNCDPALRPVDFIKISGRPEKYPIEIDVAFLEWLEDPETPLLQKGMSGMKNRYHELLQESTPFFLEEGFPFAKEISYSEEGLRLHIRSLLIQKGLVMKKPKTLDIDRLRIYDKLEAWWHDETIRNIITKTHPRLLFNADETSVSRIIDCDEKVVTLPGTVPIVPTQERGGRHTTLFLVVSAAGYRMKPVIIHAEKEKYIESDLYDVATYHTKNGYMDQKTLFLILDEVFLEHVKAVRKEVSGNKHECSLLEVLYGDPQTPHDPWFFQHIPVMLLNHWT